MSDEARTRAPALHERADVLRGAPVQENVGRLGEERVEVGNPEAVLGRLVEEAPTTRPQADSQVHVAALALADVAGVQRVGGRHALAGRMELVPEDVPLGLHGGQLGAGQKRATQGRRP